MSAVLTGHVMIGIYQFSLNGQPFLSHFCTWNLYPVLCSCEIRPHPVRVRSTVVVAITIVVDIAEVRSRVDTQRLPHKSPFFQV